MNMKNIPNTTAANGAGTSFLLFSLGWFETRWIHEESHALLTCRSVACTFGAGLLFDGIESLGELAGQFDKRPLIHGSAIQGTLENTGPAKAVGCGTPNSSPQRGLDLAPVILLTPD